jgi:SAM-dependent methyltransferase
LAEWFDNDDFWRIFGDCMFREDRFREAEAEIDALLALTGVATRSVLDLGCGPGRHAIPLAARGLEVTAVDLSPSLLERARQRAAKADVAVDWQRADMREFTRPDSFDLVISMWTSFGYFDDPGDDLKVLENCHSALHPGGALLLDVVGKEYVVRNIEPVHLTEYADGDILVERPLLEANMTRYSNEWLLIRGEQVKRANWHHNLYSGQELVDRLQSAGFADVALYGSLEGNDYDLESERLIAVAWKD